MQKKEIKNASLNLIVIAQWQLDYSSHSKNAFIWRHQFFLPPILRNELFLFCNTGQDGIEGEPAKTMLIVALCLGLLFVTVSLESPTLFPFPCLLALHSSPFLHPLSNSLAPAATTRELSCIKSTPLLLLWLPPNNSDERQGFYSLGQPLSKVQNYTNPSRQRSLALQN